VAFSVQLPDRRYRETVMDSIILYAGVVLLGIGTLSCFWRRARRRGLLMALLGMIAMVIALLLPAREERVTVAVTKLDEWVPVWQFNERHELDVGAPPDRVYAAIHAVSAHEIALFRTLTAIRRGFRKGPESILDAPEEKPLLDVATQSGFLWLADDAPREMVVGTVVVAPRSAKRSAQALTPAMFRKTLPPGFALAAMNFRVTPDGRGGSHVTTETRVFANDAVSRRAFSRYWRIIHPGSDIIRRMWLRAVRRRAEGVPLLQSNLIQICRPIDPR
jgi:hypothetical protein